jgi:hypothetical protein
MQSVEAEQGRQAYGDPAKRRYTHLAMDDDAPTDTTEPERLSEDAAHHHEDIDNAVEHIQRGGPPGDHNVESVLATLDRIRALRARMKPGNGAVESVREGRSELERRTP